MAHKIRWYLCPLETNALGKLKPRETVTSVAPSHTQSFNLNANWCLLRMRTEETNFPIIEAMGVRRLNLAALYNTLPTPIKTLLTMLDLEGSPGEDLAALLDRAGARKWPGFSRAKMRWDVIQDGVVRKESEMVEE